LLHAPGVPRLPRGQRAEAAGVSAFAVLLGQVHELTRNPLDLGWLGLAEAVPAVGLGLPGGHAADRLPRRLVLLGTAGLALLAACLAAAADNPTDAPRTRPASADAGRDLPDDPAGMIAMILRHPTRAHTRWRPPPGA